MMLDRSYFDDIRGAVYIPVRAFNAFQAWRDYSTEVSARDLGYAKKLNINALRIWMSYEFWCRERAKAEERFEDFLRVADSFGMRVMPSFFECCGREPTEANILDTDQFTGTAVRSPGTEITKDRNLWKGPFSFLDTFVERYRNDRRILAFEVTNEPKTIEDHLFAIALLNRAKSACSDIPITLGGQTLFDNILYRDCIDIYQTHENIPLSPFQLEGVLSRAKMVQEIEQKPVWVTEWQQIRKSGIGFSGEHVDKCELRPNHKSMAAFFRKHGIGNFVWNLMLRPAYLTGQRSIGTFNGLFHEDGAVYSLEDARAVAGDDKLQLEERHSLPEFFDRVAALSED